MELEEEDKTLLQMGKAFTIPDIRSGDVVKFHYLHSLSEGNGNSITGLCVGMSRAKSLQANMTVLFNFAGVPVRMKVKLNSPFLADLQLVSRGSGNLKYKLAYIWKMKRNTIPIAPIIKKSVARRENDKVKTKTEKKNKNVIVDKIDDPLIID
jgi:ribosomal protein L19